MEILSETEFKLHSMPYGLTARHWRIDPPVLQRLNLHIFSFAKLADDPLTTRYAAAAPHYVANT